MLVGPGTYVENINFNGMAITVTSEYGADTTIIDGSNPTHPDTGSVVLFISGEDSASVLNSFTIKSGTGTIWSGVALGGGIYCKGTSPIIIGNTVTDNATFSGGGICCLTASPLITDNTISRNTAENIGGGMCCSEYCSPTITGNIIDSNTANVGGGISINDYVFSDITGNTLTNNTANWGGGIVCLMDCSATIRNNTISNNESTLSGGGIACYDASPIIDSNTISENIGDGVYCEYGSNPVIYYNDIIDNPGYAVFNADPDITINADSNWWGDATGPYHATNPGGLGDTVSDYVSFTPWLTEPGIEEHEPIQTVFTNLQISPNPFSDKVDITFKISDSRLQIDEFSFKIYDAAGRLVKEFGHTANQQFNQVIWAGDDKYANKVPSGVYFLKLVTGDYSAIEKLLLIR